WRRAGSPRSRLREQGWIHRPAGAAGVVFLDARTVAVGRGAQLAENRPARLPKQGVASFEKLSEARDCFGVVDVHPRTFALQLIVDLADFALHAVIGLPLDRQIRTQRIDGDPQTD